MCVGDGRDKGSRLCVCVSVCLFAVIYSKVQDVVCVKPLGIEEIQKDLGTLSSCHKPT